MKDKEFIPPYWIGEIAIERENQLEIEAVTARALLYEQNQIFMRWYNGDIWINGELVATYEDVIQ